ncbi:hypothetical protein TorRG33x02_127020 [Trema orientale]|uniref:Uncharacterized protein n=1 Tax=Trema orientale TaxID=63057 RepID=A0A2P5F0X3_TREOI|nr:hypothetical protein TorRG33x02_127020 [Trema orientale]
MKNGICFEDEYPYVGIRKHLDSQLPMGKMRKIFPLSGCTMLIDHDDIKKWIQRTPVLTRSFLDASFTDTNGSWDVYCPLSLHVGSKPITSHVMLGIGSGRIEVEGGAEFLNGQEYGIDGFGRMVLDYERNPMDTFALHHSASSELYQSLHMERIGQQLAVKVKD